MLGVEVNTCCNKSKETEKIYIEETSFDILLNVLKCKFKANPVKYLCLHCVTPQYCELVRSPGLYTQMPAPMGYELQRYWKSKDSPITWRKKDWEAFFDKHEFWYDYYKDWPNEKLLSS